MGSYDETVRFLDLILNSYDFVIGKLHDSSAADASDVAVVPVTIDMFVMEVTIRKIDLLDQSTLDQEGNGSVDRSLGNYLSLVSQTQKKIIHIKVIMGRKNLLNDRLPFRCVPEPLLLDILSEFLNFVHDETIFIEIHFQ